MTPEQVRMWNEDYGDIYFRIDPKTRTADYYVNIKK